MLTSFWQIFNGWLRNFLMKKLWPLKYVKSDPGEKLQPTSSNLFLMYLNITFRLKNSKYQNSLWNAIFQKFLARTEIPAETCIFGVFQVKRWSGGQSIRCMNGLGRLIEFGREIRLLSQHKISALTHIH